MMFDKGYFSICDDFSITGGLPDLPDAINMDPEHEVDISNLTISRNQSPASVLSNGRRLT